jgi:hypothetical protein
MATADGTGPGRLTAEERGHLDLAASRSDLSGALTRQVDFLVKQLNKTPDEAAAFVRSRDGIRPEDQESEQITWFELANLMESEPERGELLWRRIKADAMRELRHGMRSSRSVEPKVGGHPIHRARFAVILQSLAVSLQPRDPLEELLIHQMASAYEMHLHWQDRASLRAQEEEWEGNRDRRREWERLSPAQQERYARDHGWMPARVSTAEAIDQAVTIADRYQRSFLRLMKAFRDNRRLFATLVVAGGQVNIGEQQVNLVARATDGAEG